MAKLPSSGMPNLPMMTSKSSSGGPPDLPMMTSMEGEPGDVATGGPAQGRRGQRMGAGAEGGCPPGQVMINGQCRHPGDFPCPPGQCKDVVTGQCRTPGGNEKANETDDIERASGGGRGYCKQLEPGRRRGGGGGGGASLADEQAYFDRLVGAGDWTGVGGGWFFNDPGNDPNRRVWVNRNTLSLDSTGKGYQSISDAQYKGMGSPGGASPNVTYGPGGMMMSGAGGSFGGSFGGTSFGGRGGSLGSSFGGPGGFSASTLSTAAPGDINELISGELQKIIGGATRFSPEVMNDITAGAKARQMAETQQGVEAVNEDLASRGLSSSPAGASLAQQARTTAAGRFDETMRDTRQKKAFYDFEDKMNGLSAAQKWLDSLRQYSLGLQQNSIQREQIQASLTMARKRLAAEAQNLATQLGSQQDLLWMQLGSTEWMFMQKQLQDMMGGY